MQSSLRSILMLTAGTIAAHAHAETLRVATWNLGWHVSQAELSPWLSQCSKTYAKDTQTRVWRLVPAGAPQARRGWDVTEGRATLEGVDLSIMPPCAVYLTPGFDGIEVTQTAYAKRGAQLSRMLSSDVRPDVIAFQEVSGVAAVREALGAAAADYHVCSFDGAYKVQRLAFAWRKSFGQAAEACADVRAISLPAAPPEHQVRPGYTVTLNLAGKKVRFLTVHLKSSCVTPLEGDRLDAPNADEACQLLQQQIAPIETTFEQLATGVDHFIVLGDFNRNLWHEQHQVAGAEKVRADGQTDLATPRTPGVATRNLLLEVNDGVPATSKAVLLAPVCRGSAAVAAACEASKTTKLTKDQMAALTAREGLGCRNPVGLDHVLVSESLAPAVRAVYKVSIEQYGRSLGPKLPMYPDPLLAVSDHCPLVAEIEF